MTRTVHLMRHAKSDWNTGLPDHDRPLNKRGRRAAGNIQKLISDQEMYVDLILCSSAMRTRETMEGIIGGFPEVPEVSIEDGLYGASAGELLTRLQAVEERIATVMVIAHQPGIQTLALSLAGGGLEYPKLEAGFPTAALATIDFDSDWADLAPGAGSLRSYVLPRELQA